MVRQPLRIRRKLFPYGSATLGQSRRVGPGSTFTTEDVDVSRFELKTFVIRGNRRGSWNLQVAHAGTQGYSTIEHGTFPGGGSARAVSFQEAYRMARIVAHPLPAGASGSVGSITTTFGGFNPFVR